MESLLGTIKVFISLSSSRHMLGSYFVSMLQPGPEDIYILIKRGSIPTIIRIGLHNDQLTWKSHNLSHGQGVWCHSGRFIWRSCVCSCNTTQMQVPLTLLTTEVCSKHLTHGSIKSLYLPISKGVSNTAYGCPYLQSSQKPFSRTKSDKGQSHLEITS